MTTTETQRWTVGDVTITSVVEDETGRIPPEFFFPEATAADVVRHDWLIPTYADERGRITLRVQALVIDQPGRRILVDPCVGNGKVRSLLFWNQQSWPFMERFADAGFTPPSVDTVVHTHLHADHVGWDTTLVDGAWTPTFTRARHLYTQRELDWIKDGIPGLDEDVYGDSIAPVIEAGLADIVAEDADLGDGIRLEPTPGHTPGHVSMWVESGGSTALITGDFMHHPVQFAEPRLAEFGDDDVEQARATRRRMIEQAAATGALVIGTHFGSAPAGRVKNDGDVWRFEPV